MKILITNNTLSAKAGTEGVVVELAKSLQARGHEVAACSCHVGEAGEWLREAMVPVIRDPGDSPFVPDLIHGQHHLDTMRALFALPETPAVYHCHGGLPWVERPPRHPRILHHIGMCEVMASSMALELGLPPERVHSVPNWVDLERFHTVRSPVRKPARALIFTRMLKAGFFTGELEAAFRARDIALDTSLPTEGGETRFPESLLPGYDIVLAAGRSALEAMASGCATMIVSHHSSLGFVTPGNLDTFREQNFAPRRQSPQLTRELVMEQLDAYRPEDAAAVTARVRAEASLEGGVDLLEKIYHRAIEDWKTLPRPDPAEEWRAGADYLRHLMPALQNLEGDKRLLAKRDAQVRDLKRSLKALGKADRQRDRLAALHAELRKTLPGRLALHFAKRRVEKRDHDAPPASD